MNVFVRKIVLLGVLSLFQFAQASEVPGDTLQTCKTPVQIANAKKALTWLSAVVAWNEEGVKTQSELFSETFVLWHPSLATLAAIYKTTYPELYPTLPFTNGQLTRANYAKTLAFLAESNNIKKWIEAPTRVDCFVDSNSVAIDIQFSGAIVKRDLDGYIQYEISYSAPATKVFTFDDQGKIKLQTVGVDSSISFKARAELNELLKKAKENPEMYPPLPRSEETKGTYKTYEDLFSKAFGS